MRRAGASVNWSFLVPRGLGGVAVVALGLASTGFVGLSPAGASVRTGRGVHQGSSTIPSVAVGGVPSSLSVVPMKRHAWAGVAVDRGPTVVVPSDRVSSAAVRGSSTAAGRGPSPLSVVPRKRHAPARVAKDRVVVAASPLVTSPGQTVSVPASIPADCSTDVGKALRRWLDALPEDTTVTSPANACYLINSGVLLESPPAGLTIDGGRFVETVDGDLWRRAFDVIGGTNVTFENLSIVGPDTNDVYDADKAFQSGIELQGTANAVIADVTTTNTWGDGITLAPLRGGSDHMSGRIVRPVTNLTVSDVSIDGTGRQGITFASVDGAQVSDVHVANVAMSTFDFESDQVDEGAHDVTIDGCTSDTHNGGAFVADEGAGGGAFTGDITIAHCTMRRAQGGDAIVIRNIPHAKQPRGPFVFTDDVIRCGASSYVACLELDDADVTVRSSFVAFPHGTVHEAVWHTGGQSTLDLVDNVVANYGRQGVTRPSGQVTVEGGSWAPHGPDGTRTT